MTSAEQEPRITVEVDVFSGRPNPTWQLSAGEARTLLQMLDGTRSGDSREPCAVPGLGYRGLNVKIVGGANLSHWRVFDGCVEQNGRAFADPNANVESFILRSMPPDLKSDLAGILPKLDR
jgi:hypothetical protein